jgi:hypothetical protein
MGTNLLGCRLVREGWGGLGWDGLGGAQVSGLVVRFGEVYRELTRVTPGQVVLVRFGREERHVALFGQPYSSVRDSVWGRVVWGDEKEFLTQFWLGSASPPKGVHLVLLLLYDG